MRVIYIFEDEVDSYPIDQICKDNNIPHQTIKLGQHPNVYDKILIDREYIIPGEWLLGLKKLEKWLYDGCFSDVTNQPGKVRDWANWLNQGFFGQIEPVDD